MFPRRYQLLLLLVLLVVTGVAWKRWNQTSATESSSPILAGFSSDSFAEGGITAGIDNDVILGAAHPLLPLLEIADKALENIDRHYRDYTATLTNQVRVNGKLRDPNKMFVKIRHSGKTEEGQSIPFSVYMKFSEPKSNAGREVIWSEGWNEGNLMVHLTGWQNLVRISLDPEGSVAMDGNLYPVFMIGMRNLLVQIQEKGNRDSQFDPGLVTLERGLELDGRPVTRIESIHPVRQPQFDYHIARIYLDEELGLPVGYEGFTWPEKEGDPPLLIEKYFYTDIQLNVGLTDLDFDPSNPEYDYPAR
jgi:hypothetical protein